MEIAQTISILVLDLAIVLAVLYTRAVSKCLADYRSNTNKLLIETAQTLRKLSEDRDNTNGRCTIMSRKIESLEQELKKLENRLHECEIKESVTSYKNS